jgi:hypothetical protein
MARHPANSSRWPALARGHSNVGSCPDTVEKVAAWRFQFSYAKIDLSDRPTSRSRVPVKGKKTPENLATETASDFFNTIVQTTDLGVAIDTDVVRLCDILLQDTLQVCVARSR